MAEKTGYTLHHRALERGYISRKGTGWEETYSGKFGTGIKLHLPNWQSTSYHIIEYWIKAA
jgi:hypothetical protein